jgi:hypothetical protein
VQGSADSPRHVAWYSVLRYVADVVRDEEVNVGLFLISADGGWARFRTHAPKTKLGALNRRPDAERIEAWERGLREAYRLEGGDVLMPAEGLLSHSDLAKWAKEFGGALRVTEPRVTAGKNLEDLWQTLFRRYVGRQSTAPKATLERLAPSGPAERKRLSQALLKEMRSWENFDKSLVRRDVPFRGDRLSHLADLAVGNGQVSAIAQALPFVGGTDSEIITTRALLVEAAIDLPQHVVKLGLYDDPPVDRMDTFKDTLTFLDGLDRDIELVPRREFGSLRQRFAPMLFPDSVR